MVQALRTSLRYGGLRQGGLQPGLGGDSIFATSSLDLNFAKHKNLGTIVDATTGANLVDFTRASSGTYVDSEGVIRTAVTNLLTQSESFSTWTVSGQGTTQSTDVGIVAPDGSTGNVQLFTEDLTTGVHRIFIAPITEQATKTHSVFVKAATGTREIYLSSDGPTGTRQNIAFDLQTGGIVNNTGDWSGVFITSYPNGWYRIGGTITDNGGSTLFIIGMNDGTSSYTGDGTSGIYVWGAQLEQSTTVGEYIPTTSTINSAPRFDHDPTTGESLGLLVEEQRTNSIRNSTMQGAVAGTPGTDPTNWVAAAPGNGITKELVGTGIENGIAYIDYRYYGTPTATGIIDIRPETATQVVAANGQTWTSSFYLKLVGGSLANTAVQHWMAGRLSNGTFVSNQWNIVAVVPTDVALIRQRSTSTFTFTDATVERASSFLRLYYTNGLPLDITLRIGLPQLEQGAFATSVIPTTGATATRAADLSSIGGSNFSSWYRQDEGTVFAESERPDASRPNTLVASITDGTSDNRIEVRSSSATNDNARCEIVALGSAQYSNPALPSNTAYKKIALAYAVNNVNAAANGNAGVTDTAASIPVVSQLYFGNDVFLTDSRPGHIKRLAYWPTRLPAETLQTITQ